MDDDVGFRKGHMPVEKIIRTGALDGFPSFVRVAAI
jgi:hypothetical protein